MRFLLSLLLAVMLLIIPGTQLVQAAQLSGDLLIDAENTGSIWNFGTIGGSMDGGVCTPFGDGEGDEEGSKEIGGGVLFYRK